MNTRIQRFGVFIMICYLALFVKLNQVQIFQADDLNNNPLNSRVVQREYNRPRGVITNIPPVWAAVRLKCEACEAGHQAFEATEVDRQSALMRGRR